MLFIFRFDILAALYSNNKRSISPTRYHTTTAAKSRIKLICSPTTIYVPLQTTVKNGLPLINGYNFKG